MPPSLSRRRLSAEARREQLLDAATEIVVEQSFHDVTFEAVSRRAGVTRALIYRHFSDLPQLLEAIVAREMERARAQVSATTPSDLTHGDPRRLMLESLFAFLTAVRDHPATWRLVLMPPEGAPETLRRSIAQGRAGALTRLTRAVRPDGGSDDSTDAELTARVLQAISDEYARLVLRDPKRYPPETLLRHAARWLDGLRL